MLLPILTNPSWSPSSAFTSSRSCFVIYENAIFPSSNNSNLSDTLLITQN